MHPYGDKWNLKYGTWASHWMCLDKINGSGLSCNLFWRVFFVENGRRLSATMRRNAIQKRLRTIRLVCYGTFRKACRKAVRLNYLSWLILRTAKVAASMFNTLRICSLHEQIYLTASSLNKCSLQWYLPFKASSLPSAENFPALSHAWPTVFHRLNEAYIHLRSRRNRKLPGLKRYLNIACTIKYRCNPRQASRISPQSWSCSYAYPFGIHY